MSEINITPLIDVMLALLVIFMIAAPIMTGTIHLPYGSAPKPGPPPKILELSIAADGTVSGHGMTLNELELQAQLLAFAANPAGGILQLQPDRATHHQRLVDVLSLARTAGLQSITIESPAP
ncbi:MAG: biopolymer transporter ExbD [Tahibacter sp.]